MAETFGDGELLCTYLTFLVSSLLIMYIHIRGSTLHPGVHRIRSPNILDNILVELFILRQTPVHPVRLLLEEGTG